MSENMNKAIMIATRPQWTKMIINGTKTLEFRDYPIPVGMKVYVYETLGKRKIIHTPYEQIDPSSGIVYTREETDIDYEGRGKVVLEFVVGRLYEDIELSKDYVPIRKINNGNKNPNKTLMGITYYGKVNEKCKLGNHYYDTLKLTKEEIHNIGYTNQKYAHTITDLIVYDEPLDVKEFIGWNKVDKKRKLRNKQPDIQEALRYGDWQQEFNTVKKYLGYHEVSEDCYLINPPQGRVYVVEKE